MRSIAEVRLQEGQPGALLAVVRDADARRADDLPEPGPLAELLVVRHFHERDGVLRAECLHELLVCRLGAVLGQKAHCAFFASRAFATPCKPRTTPSEIIAFFSTFLMAEMRSVISSSSSSSCTTSSSSTSDIARVGKLEDLSQH